MRPADLFGPSTGRIVDNDENVRLDGDKYRIRTDVPRDEDVLIDSRVAGQ
jgi:hypothetical protein